MALPASGDLSSMSPISMRSANGSVSTSDRIKPAVQPGRRIATLRESAGLGQAVAFMSLEADSRALRSISVSLDQFTPRTREWFSGAFAAPTTAQEQAWPAIASGEHVLLSAPTGSGKTLAAFLWAIDQLDGGP